MVATRRLAELKARLHKSALWPDSPYVVALSGGADSAALAALAVDTGELAGCVHVHHGWGASDDLAAAATAIAFDLGADLEVVEVTVPDGPSREANARDVRYQAVEACLAGNNSILLGHTLDDVAETLLINLIRGSGLKGLTGIPYRRGTSTYRPLLRVRRSETRELAMLQGLPFLDDPSNFDQSIRRNQIRLDLIPRLEKLNPSIVETLARTADHLLLDSDLLDDLTPRVGRSPSSERVRFPIGLVASLAGPIRFRAIAAEIAGLRSGVGLSAAEAGRIDDVINGVSAGAELEGGLRVERNGPMLEICVGGN